MNQKLNCILLIDDDEATNVFHRLVIEEADCAEQVIAVQSGKAALEYLISEENGKHPQPDLIFLDINMPGMNGWEFLEAYEQLDATQKGKIMIVMLTTSLNPDDEQRARGYQTITDFKSKPLTVEMLHELIKAHA